MRNIITKISRWILAAMGFAAVSGCNGDGTGGIMPAPEYGVPVASFEVKCTMTDKETGAPVKGVTMTAGGSYTENDGNGNEVERDYICAEAVEHEGGIYIMNGYEDIGSADELQVKLTDPYPEKDGHYKDSIYVVKTDKIDHVFVADVTLEAEQVK